MIMIFRYITLIVAVMAMQISAASAKVVSVEVTGYGATRKLAVVDGLKEAIAQVSGISINAIDSSSLSSFVAELSSNEDQDEKQLFTKETQSDIMTHINGYVSSYQILFTDREDDGTYKVDMTVDIEKYEVPGPENNRRGVAVIGFKAEKASCFGKPLDADKQIEGITDALVNAFTATRKFSVLDRNNDEAYALEKGLILSEDAKRSEVAKLGQVKGTDYIVTGTVKSLRIQSSKQTVSISGDTFTTYSASAEINFRLLAFASRQVKFASSVRVSLGNAEVAGKGCGDVLSLLMQKAAAQIVDKCIENIYPPMVVSVNNDKIYLNIGGESVKNGAIYAVYSVGEKIIDPYTGESLGAEESQIATLKITEVKPKYSVGTLEKGNIAEIQKGQICRYISQSASGKAKPKKAKKKKISEDEW